MTKRGEVLVAIINNQLDFAILHEKLWYRIPVSNVDKWLKDRWPPKWLAFYQTKAFEIEKHAINYFAEVLDIREVQRWQLFPDEPRDEKSTRRYYQIFVKSIRKNYPSQSTAKGFAGSFLSPQPGRSSSLLFRSMIFMTRVLSRISFGHNSRGTTFQPRGKNLLWLKDMIMP